MQLLEKVFPIFSDRGTIQIQLLVFSGFQLPVYTGLGIKGQQGNCRFFMLDIETGLGTNHSTAILAYQNSFNAMLLTKFILFNDLLAERK